MTIKSVTIAGRHIGERQKPYIVAEMSANHNGKLETALRIIEAAKDAGADAVKFQTYTPDTITLDHSGSDFCIQGGLWHNRTLYELYEEAYTPWEWHEALFAKAKQVGITAFSAPFDPTAVDFLESLGCPAYKIASFELVDIPLIQKAASTGKPLIMSTGMGNALEIREAIEAARSAGCESPIILHCVSGYPAPVDDCNIRTIQHLKSEYGVISGLSDHSLGTVVSVAAVATGASLIEKHFILSRDNGGLDSAFSLEPDELKQLVSDTHLAWLALGKVNLNRAPSEKDNAKLRRSLYAVEAIQAGAPLTTANVRSIRPGFGLPPKELPQVIGKQAERNIQRGEPLSWDLIK